VYVTVDVEKIIREGAGHRILFVRIEHLPIRIEALEAGPTYRRVRARTSFDSLRGST